MKTQLKTLTTLLLLVSLVGATAAQNRPSVQLEATLISSDPVPVQAGEEADVSFKITNNGNTEAEDVQVEILDRYPFQLTPDRKRTYDLGTIVDGESYQISTNVQVSENASDGPQDLLVRISQPDFSREAKIPLEVQSEDIELNLANLRTSPSQLMPDTEDNQMTLEVVNNGDKTAENVVLNLDYPEFFEETSSFSTRKALGNIESGETKSASFNFDINETTPSGPVDIDSVIEYSTSDESKSVEQSETFRTFINGKPQFEVVNTEADLSQGSSGNLRVQVRNIGDEKSSSTRIRFLDSSDLPFSYQSSSEFIGTLDPGQTGTAVFDITTEKSAEAKEYLLDFEIRGVKDTQVFTQDTTIPVQVNEGSSQSSNLMPFVGGIVAFIIVVLYFFKNRIREKLE